MSKIITVYGSAGSYKTTTALALAHQISKTNGNANVVVVGIDTTKPLLPMAAPHEKKFTGSLGKCLSAVSFEQDVLFRNICMLTNRVGVLSYNIRENANTYALVSPDRIDDVYTTLRHSCDFTIIDCTSDVVASKLASKAIIHSDRTLELLTCDVGGLVFDGSQEPVLQSEQYQYKDFIRLLALDKRFKQDEAAMTAAMGRISGSIPYSTKAAEYFNQGRILLDGTDDSIYNHAIKSLAKLLTEEE